ncbi:MAG: DNA mismatch repair endonuclease MutL, partial [Verrucomicrobiaceae bacterium]
EIAVQSGGSALIRVTDNGSGMGREDAMLCIERHATSKIRTKEDLGAIHTYGFRGEALPSIASVSRFRLSTREREALSGTEIEIHGGKLIAVRDGGVAPGCMVEVRSLFFNVPARRKFLRAETTEYAHIEQQFRLHAIANPHVAFTLIKDGEPVYHLPVAHDLMERIRGLVGDELAQRLLPVIETERHEMHITGYIGGPGYSRSNKQMQLVFLNGRCVESAPLHYGLREGYHTTLMKGQYPVTFLFVRMDAHAYDVNVHPTKKEVRFYDGHAVREAVAQAVRNTLNQTRVLPQGHAPSRPSAPLPVPPLPLDPAVSIDQQVELAIPAAQQQVLRRDWSEVPVGRAELQTTADTEQQTVAPIAVVAPPPAVAPSLGKSSSEEFKILGVLGKLYVLMEGKEGLVLMDQHAAHERVLFEKMRYSMEREGVPSQRLLMPLMLHVSPRDYELLSRNLAPLAKLGIEAEPFGANTLKVDALPAFLHTDDSAALLSQIVDELASLSSKSSSLRLGEDMIATTACRHAVKANDHLRGPELESLVQDLMACEMPYCCPHGRPTLIQISYPELERKFGRRAP